MKTFKTIVRELEELSKETLGSYVKKASQSVDFNSGHNAIAKNRINSTTFDDEKKHLQKIIKNSARRTTNRKSGISKAVDRLTKESVDMDELNENHGSISVDMKHMHKWKVDSDNVKYYDHIHKNKGKVQTLDVRPYVDHLTDFNIPFKATGVHKK